MYKINTLGVLLMLFAVSFTAQAQIFVSDIALNGNNDGSSWTDAYLDLGTAINAAQDGDEIWVALGQYTPPSVILDVDGEVDTTHSFVIDKNIKLYGGFFGIESSLDERNYLLNATILDGDVNGDDIPGDFTMNKSDNARHVIFIAPNVSSDAVVDGFYVLRGAALGPDDEVSSYGGGLCKLGQAKVNNMTIQQCSAKYGGGIYVSAANGGASFENFNVDNNYATYEGGGIYATDLVAFELKNSKVSRCKSKEYGNITVYDTEAVRIQNCVIRENSAETYFGALFVEDDQQLLLDSVLIYENTSGSGIVGTSDCDLVKFDRVAITNNSADSVLSGLGMSGGMATLTNVLVGDNVATIGGNLGQVFVDNSCNLDFCTIYGDKGGLICDAVAQISNSIIYGGTVAYGGAGNVQSNGGNICNDNSMAAILTATGDLSNTDPDISLNPDTYFMPRGSSPAVDASVNAGSISVDAFSNPRIGVPDIGAVEFDGVATTSTNIPDVTLEVYPTLTEDLVTVRWDNESIATIDYRIINANGQEVLKGDELQNQQTISLGAFATGAYQIVFITTEGHTTRTVIVK